MILSSLMIKVGLASLDPLHWDLMQPINQQIT